MGVLSGEQPGNGEDSGRNWEGPPTGATLRRGHPRHDGGTSPDGMDSVAGCPEPV